MDDLSLKTFLLFRTDSQIKKKNAAKYSHPLWTVYTSIVKRWLGCIWSAISGKQRGAARYVHDSALHIKTFNVTVLPVTGVHTLRLKRKFCILRTHVDGRKRDEYKWSCSICMDSLKGAVQCLLIIPLPDIKHLLTISRVFIDSQKKSDALQTAFIIKGKKKGKKSSQLDAIHINNYQISSTGRVKWGIVDMISMSIIKKGWLVNTPLRARIISYRRTNYSYLIWSHQMKALMRRRKDRFGERGYVLHRWRF